MADLAQRAVLFVAGVAIVAAVVYDLLVSVVVPRPTPGRWRLSNLWLRYLWPLWRWSGLRVRAERREAILASFAPMTIIGLLVIWVTLLSLGYALVLWAMREQLRPQPPGFGTAVYLSAVALLTIGFGDIVPIGDPARFVVLAEAGTGLGSVALVISMLFSLFNSFQRREQQVITLDASAGAPPSGLLLLETARKLKMPELLDRTFDEWKRWSADVLESHLTYPILNYFRSTHDNESWVSALGAVLDAATLIITSVEGERVGPARLMFQVGTHLVEDLSHFLDFDHVHQPGIERFEFDEACGRLEKAGYRVRPRDEAWDKFAELRSTYAAPLNEMARYCAIPPSQWIGDRSLLRRFVHPARSAQHPD